MRMILVAAALALAACTVETTAPTLTSGDAAGGYTLELFAANDAQVYRITTPDGAVVAAQASGDASMMTPATEVQGFFESMPAAPRPEEADVAIRLPGVDLRVAGQKGGATDQARISINVAGKEVLINAEDNGVEGDQDTGQARIRITGADADAARDFIADADGLSEEVKAQLRTAAGL
ncbi:MAG: hypothetical protein NW203_07755 [Hyphomonadaceae bacterium]|nr:hypothetical protein [Hyphomonadaceae bacterium]